jgi:hypothetical protein
MMDLPPVQTTYFPLRGGLNLVTPPLSIPDGYCREALNFEQDIDGGYRRIAGYERFDGQPTPSDATYYIIYCTFVGSVANGDTITGLTSGATGVAIEVGIDYIAFTKLVGSFTSTEDIQVSAVTVATAASEALQASAPSQLLNAQYYNLAADEYRADILAVPGSGDVLGVHRYNNVVYAFRNNAGGTAAVLHKSTVAGWAAITLGNEVRFTNANVSVGDLDTLTQGAVTAPIQRVVVETGSLASGVNTGRLIIGTVSGGNYGAGAATSTGGGTLTLSAIQTAITLAPGGRYEFVNHNFGGMANSSKMYGASGTHRAFEFDGTVFVPISTGMVTDTPKHIAIHSNHLFLSFEGSNQHSGTGTPYMWTVITGAGELAVGDTVTGYLSLVGSNATASLAIFTTNKTHILYGTSAADWSLVIFSFESGGFEYTQQNIGQGYVLDTLGIRQISSTDAFGNFENAQITKLVRPFILSKITRSVGSVIVRSRNQYRIFFSDGTGLYVTFDNNKVTGIMPIEYAHNMSCMTSYESDSGEEFVYAGDTNGYVYRMDKGTSFDGEEINAYINLAFSFMKNPRIKKRFRKAVYEISGGNYAEIQATYELGYASTEIDQGTNTDISTPFSSFFWDSVDWDAFYWDGRNLLPAEQDLTGTAENVSLIVRSMSDYFAPFTINSAIIHYTNRRLMR